MSTSDEIGSSNRLFKVVIILIVLIVLPSIILSTPGLDLIQEKVVNRNDDKPWAADVEKWIAHCFAYTLRHEHAAERYEWTARLYNNQRDNEAAGNALYWRACEIEDFPNASSKYEALAIYEQIAGDYKYKDLPVAQKANRAIVRIKTLGRP